ncbi:hypothetical protein KIPB_011640, partial [Kipferlia bialata]
AKFYLWVDGVLDRAAVGVIQDPFSLMELPDLDE